MAETKWTARVFGRGNRIEFWISFVVVFSVGVALNLTLKNQIVSAFIVLLPQLLIYTRRLHDMGQVWWWSLVPSGTGFAFGFVKGFSVATTHVDPTWLAPIQGPVTALVFLAFVLFLGIKGGTKGPNRYGPAHGAAPAPDVEVFD